MYDFHHNREGEYWKMWERKIRDREREREREKRCENVKMVYADEKKKL